MGARCEVRSFGFFPFDIVASSKCHEWLQPFFLDVLYPLDQTFSFGRARRRVVVDDPPPSREAPDEGAPRRNPYKPGTPDKP
jgi:hypothetical protein